MSELQRQKDDADMYTYELFREAAFKNHPYGLPELGIANAIQKITPDHLINWHTQNIRSSNLVMVAIGDFHPLDLRAHIETYFKGIPPATRPWPEISKIQAPSFISENFKLQKREQTALLMGFQGAPQQDEDYYPLKVLESLTTSLGGRFGKRLRVKEKLAYIVSSRYHAFLHAGIFTTYTATSPENEKKALRYLLEEYKRLRDEPIEKEELVMAKNSILGQFHSALQYRNFRAHLFARQEIYEMPIRGIKDFSEKINAVTAQALSNVALKYFNLENYTLGVIRGESESKSIISTPSKPIVVPKPKVEKKEVDPRLRGDDNAREDDPKKKKLTPQKILKSPEL